MRGLIFWALVLLSIPAFADEYRPPGSSSGALTPTTIVTSGNITDGGSLNVTGVADFQSTVTFHKDVQAQGSTATFNASLSLDWSLGPVISVVLTGAVTSTTWTSMAPRGKYMLEIIQGGSGSYTMTWPVNMTWPSSGSAPALSTVAGSRDYFMFYNGLDGKIHCLAEAFNN